VTINDPGFAAGADDVARPEEWSGRHVTRSLQASFPAGGL